MNDTQARIVEPQVMVINKSKLNLGKELSRYTFEWNKELQCHRVLRKGRFIGIFTDVFTGARGYENLSTFVSMAIRGGRLVKSAGKLAPVFA